MEITPTTFIKQAISTAEYFGFSNLDVIKKHPSCKNCTTKLENTASAMDRRIDNLNGLLTTGINNFCDNKLNAIEEPVLFYTIEQVPRSGEAAISFQIYNVNNSIAESILIQTTKSLSNDLGYQNHSVRINSLGDRDSSTRFVRELSNYLRKRVNDLPESAREIMKEDTVNALFNLLDQKHELAYKSPNPLEYLTDQSRKHFREIIEFLDMSETSYEIDSKLMGHNNCYSEAMFAIDLLDNKTGEHIKDSPITISGGRYNEFVHRNTKQPIPAAGAVVVLQKQKAPTRLPRIKLSTPSVYVVQLGLGPKMRSLILIDQLKQAGINVYQDLASDSLSTQLRDAENKGVPYAIIIGQKEFVEGGVILRDMVARNQEQVSFANVITRLKRSKKVPSTN